MSSILHPKVGDDYLISKKKGKIMLQLKYFILKVTRQQTLLFIRVGDVRGDVLRIETIKQIKTKIVEERRNGK